MSAASFQAHNDKTAVRFDKLVDGRLAKKRTLIVFFKRGAAKKKRLSIFRILLFPREQTLS